MNRSRITKIEVLKERHQQLDDKVDEMSKQSFLSNREKLDLKTWKVLRLRCKDAIAELENSTE